MIGSDPICGRPSPAWIDLMPALKIRRASISFLKYSQDLPPGINESDFTIEFEILAYVLYFFLFSLKVNAENRISVFGCKLGFKH